MIMNRYFIFILVLLAFAGAYFGFYQKHIPLSYKDVTFTISGEQYTMKNGYSSVPAAPGSESQIVTKYFGNEAKSDFDKDGREDVAYLITQNTGGSGTFYYLVVALNKKEGFVGGEAMFIGDRISPQNTNIDSRGFIVINYADRAPGESFVVAPSIGKTIYAKFDPKSMSLGEVVQNFEGESNI